MFVATVGAGAGDIAVGEKLSGLLVVILLALLFDEDALVIERAEEVGGHAMVHLGGGAGVDVKRDAEALEGVLDKCVVAVYDVLRGDTFLLGAEGDGHAVLIRPTDEEDVASAESQIARVDVGRQVDTGKVSDMHRPVSVGQCGGDEGAFEILFCFFHRGDRCCTVYLCSFSLWGG